MGTVASLHAPTPDFRYIGLEPVTVRGFGTVATAFGLGAGVTLAMSGLDLGQALGAGLLTSLASAFALRGAGAGDRPRAAETRMAIVPWGVLVEGPLAPRILRWAAVRRVEAATCRSRSLLSRSTTLVVIETEHDRFVGEAPDVACLDLLAEHLEAYAREQSTPLALDFEGERATEALESELEVVFAAARTLLTSGHASARLGLPSGGYRTGSARVATDVATDELRGVLGDRTPKDADPRALAAIIAAEIGARDALPELVRLTQCPHALVAAIARQAARRLGVPSARTGPLDEVAPFLGDGDRALLQAWVK